MVELEDDFARTPARAQLAGSQAGGYSFLPFSLVRLRDLDQEAAHSCYLCSGGRVAPSIHALSGECMYLLSSPDDHNHGSSLSGTYRPGWVSEWLDI